MPVVLRLKGYKFWFYEADLDEPPHIHAGKQGKEAKYWLNPITPARIHGFRPQELVEIERIIAEHKREILDAWEKEQSKRVSR